MIVIAEHELMKTELKFAIFQGIPVHEANQVKHNKTQKSNMVKPEDIKGKLKQWRILFYLDFLKDFDLLKLLKEKEEDEPFYIQIKLFEYFTKFELNIPKMFKKGTKSMTKLQKLKAPARLLTAHTKRPSTIKSKFGSLLSRSSQESMSEDEDQLEMAVRNKKMSIKLNKLRVHYFFTEFYEISNFLKNTKIEIRITKGDDWNKPLGVGAISPFYDMNPSKYDMVQTEYLRVPFLSQHIDDFYLTMK